VAGDGRIYLSNNDGKTFVVAIAGELIAAGKLASFAQDLAILQAMGIKIVLVHGFRPQVDEHLRSKGHAARYSHGLRITDAIALDERDPRALCGRVQRGDVPAGAATEDRDVVPLLAHLVEQPSRARRVTFQWMCAIATAQHEPEIERDERKADPLVLLDVPALVKPEAVTRLARADDHVPECDRRVAAHRDEQVREATIRHVQEAPVAYSRARERQHPDQVAERIGVMSGERADEIS